MQIARKLYYDLSTGNVIKDRGERQNDVFETTEDQDFSTFLELKGLDKSKVGVLQLNYGDYATEYQTTHISHVDPATLALTFSPYPTPK